MCKLRRIWKSRQCGHYPVWSFPSAPKEECLSFLLSFQDLQQCRCVFLKHVKTRNLKVICEEIIPRNHADILQLIYGLSNQNGPLEHFERTLMTMVYTTQQMVNTTGEHQQGVWEESFVNLYKAIKQDLTEMGWKDTAATQTHNFEQNIHLLKSVRVFPDLPI